MGSGGISGQQKLSKGALVGLVVGAMIGSGIFSIPGTLSRSTGGLGAMIAWTIAAIGMLMLAMVFKTLSLRRADLDTGVYSYARAGFGRYLGFNSALGYWVGCCLADVVCLVHIKATLGKFFPAFGDGTTVPAIIGATVLLWCFHFVVLHDVKKAVALNTIATVIKIIPIVIFIVVAIAGFNADIFALNFWGGDAPTFGNVSEQVRSSMLVTVFVFVGLEGASVFSRYASGREHIGYATVLGAVSVLCLVVLVSMLSYGVLLRPELAALPSPAMGSVMASIVGPWRWAFISVGLLISILGNYLAWSLLATEVLHAAAKTKTMPSFLAMENDRGAPAASLWLTNIVIQIFLLISWFAEHAFSLALQMTSSMTLVPYLLVAAFGLKLAWTGESYEADGRERRLNGVQSAIAVVFALGMLYAGGPKFLLLSSILYACGTALFLLAQREHQGPAFTRAEWLVFLVLVVLAVVALGALYIGHIKL